jgi:hypothetical protein
MDRSEEMYYFVKCRINVAKMAEFGKKLQNGEIPSHPISTFCLKDDPSVGLNIWEAVDEVSFNEAFKPHREFYAEVLEISPVITPQEAMNLLSPH